MSPPLVSVVIPSWNRAGLLGDALDSVLWQRYAGLQVIVVDDGSVDETRSLLARYPDVDYIYQDHQGSASARNTGIGKARGEYVAFLDSDDVWLPGKLETELQLFQAFPAARAIISDSEHWLGETRVRTSRFEATGLGGPTEPWFLPRDSTLWVDVSLFSTCCLIVERGVLETVGQPVFETALGANEDWDFEIRMYQACEVLVCPRVLAKVRRYPDDTRGGRALPGTQATVEQLIGAANRHRSILQRALSLSSLTCDQVQKLHAKIATLDGRIADLSCVAASGASPTHG
jgi:glycosyltransferase involved in cell wall biosynthesis